jgi:hypothetical protein
MEQQQQQQQQAIEVNAIPHERGDDTIESVKPKTDITLTEQSVDDDQIVGQIFNEVVFVISHGCNTTDVVDINNPKISLLATARNGTTAKTPSITRFGPPNIPSILKKIGRRDTLTLGEVVKVVKQYTGHAFSPNEAFFSEGTEFVILTPTVETRHFQIHDAKLFQAGCKIRHSGIFALGDDGEVEDITPQFGLIKNPNPKIINHTCNSNLADQKAYHGLIKNCEQHNGIIQHQRVNYERELQNNKTLTDEQKKWLTKNIKRLDRLRSRNDDDIAYLKYKLTSGHVESGSHIDPGRPVVLLSNILNHSYFKKDGTAYLVILHVCKVPCDQRAPFMRIDSFGNANAMRHSFSAATGLTRESHSRDETTAVHFRRDRSRSPSQRSGGNRNRRKSSFKKKKMHNTSRAVGRKKRSRTKRIYK